MAEQERHYRIVISMRYKTDADKQKIEDDIVDIIDKWPYATDTIVSVIDD